MDKVFLFRYHADLPWFDNQDENWEWSDRTWRQMDAWKSAAAALRTRGDMLMFLCGFAHIIMVARAQGWRSPLVDAVMWESEDRTPIRIDDTSARDLAAALRTALLEGDGDDPYGICGLVDFCDRGGFDAVGAD